MVVKSRRNANLERGTSVKGWFRCGKTACKGRRMFIISFSNFSQSEKRKRERERGREGKKESTHTHVLHTECCRTIIDEPRAIPFRAFCKLNTRLPWPLRGIDCRYQFFFVSQRDIIPRTIAVASRSVFIVVVSRSSFLLAQCKTARSLIL